MGSITRDPEKFKSLLISFFADETARGKSAGFSIIYSLSSIVPVSFRFLWKEKA